MSAAPRESVRAALAQLLASGRRGRLGGFVIFDDGDGDEFVQFALQDDGLLMNWPNMNPTMAAKLDDAARLLDALGIGYERADDGIDAKFGDDIEAAQGFTIRAFEEIYRRGGLEKLNVQLELEG